MVNSISTFGEWPYLVTSTADNEVNHSYEGLEYYDAVELMSDFINEGYSCHMTVQKSWFYGDTYSVKVSKITPVEPLTEDTKGSLE